MDIKVSVVVAAYNSEKYIRQTIDSLISQTMKDIEIILVDDGSADSTLSILKEYEFIDGRVRVLQNTEESDGAAAARNLGVFAARGEYLSVVDADDFFEPNMLEETYNCAKRYGSEVTIYDGYRYDDLNDIDLERDTILCSGFLPKLSNERYDSVDGSFSFSPMENANELFRMTLGAAWNVLFLNSFVKSYDLKFAAFHHADDLEFVYMAFALAKTIAILPKRLMHYRVNHAGTQASQVSLWPDTAWQAMLSLKEHLVRVGVYDKYRVAFIRVATKYQLFYLGAMNDVDSFRRLYSDLHNGKLQELDIARASVDELGDENFVKQRDIILKEEADGYLFKKEKHLPPFDDATSWKKNIPRGSSLVIYGADRLGDDVIHSILWNQDYKLVAWIDDQYESLGYPVMSPEELCDKDSILRYDFILVVSRSRAVFDKRRTKLVNMGIDETKIRWQDE